MSIDTSTLPFVRPQTVSEGTTLLLFEVERAFPNHQLEGTRLVLTQSTYTLQKWIDTLGTDGRIVATADRTALQRGAPEAFQKRGPWSLFEIVDVGVDLHGGTAEAMAERTEDIESTHHLFSTKSVDSAVALLVQAYEAESAAERVMKCREAVAAAPDSEVAHLALASACRETTDMPAARTAFGHAIELAPDWEAAYFEYGKFWLSCDDMEQARDAFQRACDLMPTFAAAFSNLGATAGELDEPERALAAFRQALAHDPHAFQAWNNVGVVSRELGRLDDSEAAFRRVIELAPDFVFGYYNLGHTMFLAGNYTGALAAYEEGQCRDPEKNRRQGCRLAMMRLANGDGEGAARDFWHFADQAPPEERDDLLLEGYEIAQAILAANPELAVHRGLVDRIGHEIAP